MGDSLHVEARRTGPLSAVVTAREHELDRRRARSTPAAATRA